MIVWVILVRFQDCAFISIFCLKYDFNGLVVFDELSQFIEDNFDDLCSYTCNSVRFAIYSKNTPYYCVYINFVTGAGIGRTGPFKDIWPTWWCGIRRWAKESRRLQLFWACCSIKAIQVFILFYDPFKHLNAFPWC